MECDAQAGVFMLQRAILIGIVAIILVSRVSARGATKHLGLAARIIDTGVKDFHENRSIISKTYLQISISDRGWVDSSQKNEHPKFYPYLISFKKSRKIDFVISKIQQQFGTNPG